MASFLKGLMGALGGIGKGVGDGIGLVGGGLMSALDGGGDRMNDTARQPGTGGLMPAVSDLKTTNDGRFMAYADANLDDPLTRNLGISEMRRMPTMESSPKKGFFEGLREVDEETGMSKLDRFDRFGARLQDISDGGDRALDFDKMASGRVAKARQADLAAQIDSLFPNDPRMRFLLKANPEKATEALASVYQKEREPYTLSEGQVRGQGGRRVDGVAKYGVDDGTPWAADEDGFEWGQQRPRTWQEIETERHNRERAEIDRGQLGVSRDRLAFDRSKPRAGASGAAGPVIPPLPPGFRPVR